MAIRHLGQTAADMSNDTDTEIAAKAREVVSLRAEEAAAEAAAEGLVVRRAAECPAWLIRLQSARRAAREAEVRLNALCWETPDDFDERDGAWPGAAR